MFIRTHIHFACGYEAEPTGYGLCRGLQKAGFGCVVMIPTTMSNPEGKKRVKTDRIGARAIARILAYKSYSQVHLPSEEIEAFYNCANVTSITIPSGVTAICDSTFHGCSRLKEVNIPSYTTVKDISEKTE